MEKHQLIKLSNSRRSCKTCIDACKCLGGGMIASNHIWIWGSTLGSYMCEIFHNDQLLLKKNNNFYAVSTCQKYCLCQKSFEWVPFLLFSKEMKDIHTLFFCFCLGFGILGMFKFPALDLANKLAGVGNICLGSWTIPGKWWRNWLLLCCYWIPNPFTEVVVVSSPPEATLVTLVTKYTCLPE